MMEPPEELNPEPAVTWTTEHRDSGVLHIAFVGKGGIGSEGNDDGIRMRKAVRHVLVTQKPTALLIDLRSFDYEFGNWIGGAPLEAVKSLGSGRVCLVAGGATIEALQSLWALGLDQMVPLFRDPEEARRYLRGELEEGNC